MGSPSQKWRHPGGKLRELGPDSLTDTELLAILISSGIKGRPVEKIAEEILANFGSFKGMANQPLHKFLRIKGLGDVKIIRIAAAFEIALRIVNQGKRGLTSFPARQFERSGTEELENPHVFNLPNVVKAGDIQALRILGEPTKDIINIIPSNTEVRIYDDKLIVWSPGGLPFGITIEELYKPHSSVLRNKGIGGVFYDMGWIEQWESGIDKMCKACMKTGLPEPQFEEYQGFRVIFRRDIYTEEYLRNLSLNDRQIKAVMYVKDRGKITNKEYRGMFGITDRMALIDLSELCAKEIFERVGKTGRKTEYLLIR